MQNLGKYAPQALGVLRIVAALLFIEHGTMKLIGWPIGSEGSLSGLMLLGALLETFGGLALLVGVMTRPVAFVLSGEMAAAYWMFHAPKSFFPVANGGDAAILFCFVFLYLVFAGPGAWSVDGARRKA